MSNELTAFNFESNKIRVVPDGNGGFRIVAKDVLSALNYSTDNVTARIGHVPEEWKGHSRVGTPGGVQNMAVLTKQGLIYFLSRSDRPKAQIMIRKFFESATGIDEIIWALRDFEIPDDLPDMYVYAIRETETGRVKLGISRDPEARLRQLQTGNSQELELVAFRKAENRFDDERALHTDASDYRIRGEWFTADAVNLLH